MLFILFKIFIIIFKNNLIEKAKTEGGNVEDERKYVAEILIELARYTFNNEKND